MFYEMSVFELCILDKSLRVVTELDTNGRALCKTSLLPDPPTTINIKTVVLTYCNRGNVLALIFNIQSVVFIFHSSLRIPSSTLSAVQQLLRVSYFPALIVHFHLLYHQGPFRRNIINY